MTTLTQLVVGTSANGVTVFNALVLDKALFVEHRAEADWMEDPTVLQRVRVDFEDLRTGGKFSNLGQRLMRSV